MIKFRILRWGKYPGLWGEPSVITRVFVRGRQKSGCQGDVRMRVERKKAMRQQKQREIGRCCATGCATGWMEDGS